MGAGDGEIPTERLLLQPLRAEDADDMVDVLGDERLHDFIEEVDGEQVWRTTAT